MRTAVLIPCYNEAATIESVVHEFLTLDPSVTVYVYDNNSTDDTARIAKAAGAVVQPESRQGKGWVVRSMFREIEADCYLMVDGDATYAARDVLDMRALIESGRADMVVGDRSGVYDSTNTRRFHGFGNRLVKVMVNFIFGSSLQDIMSGSRCMSRQFVKTIPVTCVGFEIEAELTVHALDKGFVVAEVPVSYTQRGPGSESKLSTFSDGARIIHSILRLCRDYRPLLFFGSISALLMIVAILMFLAPLGEYLRFGFVYKIPTLVVSIALGISSLVALVCGVLLDSIRSHSRSSYEFVLLEYAAREADAKRS